MFRYFKLIDLNQLSELIIKLRTQRGLNTSQAAKKLGISSQLLGMYERGERTPKGQFYQKWQEVFNEDILKQIETKTETKVSHKAFMPENKKSGSTEPDVRDKLINRLEKEVERLEKMLESNLDEIKSNQIVLASFQSAATKAIFELLLKGQKGKPAEELMRIVRNEAFSVQEKPEQAGKSQNSDKMSSR